ncbi:MAG: OmpA family protein [Bacteroidales bacterium]|nr:OmpA family protein [Bacteroidales bacterium]
MSKKLLFILFAILLGCAQPLEAQRRNPAKSADVAFERGQYSLAIERYKKAVKKMKKKKYEDERTRVYYQLAECFRLTENAKQAATYYKRVGKTEFPKGEPVFYLHYGDVLKRNQKYDEALECYNTYTELVPDDPRGQRAADDIAKIQEWLEYPSKYEVTRVKALNSKASDFGAAWITSGFNDIIFCSTREGGVAKEKDAITGQHFADFYASRQDKKGNWDKPELVDEEGGINTKGSEGTPFFTKTFSDVYFTRCPNDKKRQSGCQIMKSRRTGTTFAEATVVEIAGVDSLDIVGHPTLTSDESIMYFAADRKGGFGGKDIWVTIKGEDGNFGRPYNLGEVINTAGDEMFPFLRNDTTLYFSSDGHGGMGGLDIFVTTIDTAGYWTEPENLKSPINSIGNDFSIMFHPDEERGFFASNRDSRNGQDDDIYYFMEPPILFTVNGTIKNRNSLQFVGGANVSIAGTDGTRATTLSSDKGAFQFNEGVVNLNNIYVLTIEKNNYFTMTDTISTVGLEFSRDFTPNYEIEMIPTGTVVLPEIQYELGKWDLLPQFEDSLQGLIEILQVNQNITIELGSHTDNRGSEASNDILSQKRAQSVCDYLIIRGIDPLRLTAKGYGERVPRTLNKDFVYKGYTFKEGTKLTETYINGLTSEDLKEYAHQLNRRTEFKVLSRDYKPREDISDDQMANIKVNPDDNKVPFAQDKTGLFSFKTYVNAYTEYVTYDRDSEFSVSQSKVMQMLNDGVIDKNDFVGDNIDRIITAGAVKDRSTFIIKEMRIADRTVENIEVTVVNSLRYDWVIGQQDLKKFGNFEFNTDELKLIFK